MSQAARRKRIVADNKRRSATRQATARSKQLRQNTLRVSKNSPPVATSGGSGGAKKPPTTKTGTAAKEPSRSTGGRSGKRLAKSNKAVGASKPRTSTGVAKATRGEKRVPGSHRFVRPKGLPKPTTVAKGVGKAAGGMATAALGVAATAQGYIDKNAPRSSRPTVKEHAAKEKARLAKMKGHNFKKPLTGKVSKGAPPGTMAAGAKKARDAQSREWVKNFKAPAKKAAAGGTKSAPSGTKSAPKKRGYTYTGPKVGSAEYKAMRAKKQAGYTAKARRNIAASRAGTGSSKSKGVAQQQGSAKPNYESYKRGLQAPAEKQHKWTDNESTNQALKNNEGRSKLYGVRKVLSAMGYAGEVR